VSAVNFVSGQLSNW